jgi:hypothetical protein
MGKGRGRIGSEKLFDSLMQGYPFVTFLFWKVEESTSGKFKFYDFVLNPHSPDDAAIMTASDPEKSPSKPYTFGRVGRACEVTNIEGKPVGKSSS